MTSQQITARENGRKLNDQINNQLTRNGILLNGKYTGKKIEDVENLDWVIWIKELIIIRDKYWTSLEN